jgi:hypothetical protein
MIISVMLFTVMDHSFITYCRKNEINTDGGFDVFIGVSKEATSSVKILVKYELQTSISFYDKESYCLFESLIP